MKYNSVVCHLEAGSHELKYHDDWTTSDEGLAYQANTDCASAGHRKLECAYEQRVIK